VGRIGASDPATAGIAAPEWIEMEEGLARRRQATSTRGAGDRRVTPIANG
jgi:hypothetical protein